MLKPDTEALRAPLNAFLDQHLATVENAHLQAAMRYSVDAGGKRLRPLLLLATVATFGGEVEAAMPAAAALELVHTYSLIHDDLPEMDNDDLRRGQPTAHKKFDVATAVLAGDALQSEAFTLLGQLTAQPQVQVALLQTLAAAIGGNGMVGGQVMDMDSQGQTISLADLKQLQRLKTGALLEAAVVMGGQLANVDAATFGALRAFAAHFGLAFQIQDDINDLTKTAAQLGKTPNKDVAEHKATFPALLGLAGSREALQQEVAAAAASLATLNQPAPQLSAFLTYFETR
ncbi:polyprenyl synthetase family protein [Lacticaseibacillus suilingensis]|uniref:Polyprenyl synthetase family protein n=1 Tax=Lacticaseibacillus suilingensis TaxID=2799577 RepID=A0ABW4BGL6_9LACO|nr:farnesyl diphosphate synthase [Lacticaseibacillus suilingensis]